jgi:hypothetical protein
MCCDLLLIAYLEPGLGYVPAGCANLADDIIRWYAIFYDIIQMPEKLMQNLQYKLQFVNV